MPFWMVIDIYIFRKVYYYYCIISKNFERRHFLYLYPLLEPLFHPAQYCFLKGRSCILQLLIYVETIYNALESRHCVDVKYTDYEKAFDNVDHGSL